MRFNTQRRRFITEVTSCPVCGQPSRQGHYLCEEHFTVEREAMTLFQAWRDDWEKLQATYAKGLLDSWKAEELNKLANARAQAIAEMTFDSWRRKELSTEVEKAIAQRVDSEIAKRLEPKLEKIGNSPESITRFTVSQRKGDGYIYLRLVKIRGCCTSRIILKEIPFSYWGEGKKEMREHKKLLLAKARHMTAESMRAWLELNYRRNWDRIIHHASKGPITIETFKKFTISENSLRYILKKLCQIGWLEKIEKPPHIESKRKTWWRLKLEV